MTKHPNLRVAYVAQHAFHHIEKHLDKTPNEYIQWRYAGGEDREEQEKVSRQVRGLPALVCLLLLARLVVWRTFVVVVVLGVGRQVARLRGLYHHPLIWPAASAAQSACSRSQRSRVHVPLLLSCVYPSLFICSLPFSSAQLESCCKLHDCLHRRAPADQ